MTMTKEIFADLLEEYNTVLKLIDGRICDPDSDPYASKYAARQMLMEMEANLENAIKNYSGDTTEHLKITAILGAVCLYLGMISIDVEELSTGECYLKKCQVIIKDYFNTPQIVMVTLNMYNQFGILWSQREPETSKSYLEKGEALYFDYKKLALAPVDIEEIFNPNVAERNVNLAWKNFEKIHTFTLYYLAQIYGTLKNPLKSSIYCHITLQKQLDSGDYDPVDWALNAATLSQFFMENNGFKQAKHHLAASSCIIEKYEQTLNAVTERNEAYDFKMEILKHRSADIARCWAKYGLLLLTKSKERLLNCADDVDTISSISSDLSTLKLDSEATVTLKELENLYFTSMNLSLYENQITDKFLLTMQDARVVFLNIRTWLHKARTYYTLETLASDHIEIVQDQSQMYLNLLFFEDNPENQAKLHKRRIDLLENIIKKVNPQYYLQYCRQIWFELAQTYLDILNIKFDKLRDVNDRASPQVLIKINYLIERSIYNFTCFADSLEEGSKTKSAKKIPDDFEKAYLQAYFHIGALNNKYITLDKKTQLSHVETSYATYKKVVEYSELRDNVKELIPMELSICKEMIALLPIKIAKLTQELLF